MSAPSADDRTHVVGRPRGRGRRRRRGRRTRRRSYVPARPGTMSSTWKPVGPPRRSRSGAGPGRAALLVLRHRPVREGADEHVGPAVAVHVGGRDRVRPHAGERRRRRPTRRWRPRGGSAPAGAPVAARYPIVTGASRTPTHALGTDVAAGVGARRLRSRDRDRQPGTSTAPTRRSRVRATALRRASAALTAGRRSPARPRPTARPSVVPAFNPT